MAEESTTMTQRWLSKAWHDLVGAGHCSVDDDVTLDVAVYHCQQAGEKALKGFLHFHGREVPKTHDLRALIPRCADIVEGFTALDPDAEGLTPLATAFRYPDDYVPLNPTRAQFDDAHASAKRIYDFVLSLLPKETHPT